CWRRITSPSFDSRESTTLSPRCAQYEHFMTSDRAPGLDLRRETLHPLHGQAGLRREDEAEEQHRDDGEQMQYDRRADRRRVRRAEERRRAVTKRGMEAAHGARRRHRDADRRERNNRKRPRERDVEAKRRRARPQPRADRQPQRERPQQRHDETARPAHGAEAARKPL